MTTMITLEVRGQRITSQGFSQCNDWLLPEARHTFHDSCRLHPKRVEVGGGEKAFRISEAMILPGA